MEKKERDEKGTNRRPETERPKAVRRAYKTPKVETHPLFERMALNCNSDSKNTGMDDFS